MRKLFSLILCSATLLPAGIGPAHRVHIKVPVAIGAVGALIGLGSHSGTRHVAKGAVVKPAKATARAARAVGRTAVGRKAKSSKP